MTLNSLMYESHHLRRDHFECVQSFYMSKRLNLNGHRFGRLVAVEFVGLKNNTPHVHWKCKCDCGKMTVVSTVNLRSGHTKSCGCLASETVKTNSVTHGLSGSREYTIWSAMKQRCYDPNAINYERYGAKGIKVCDQWLNSFESFIKDMGMCPEGCSLDRHPDNRGNYEPSNCRWATDFQQRTNRSDNRIVTCDGKSMTAVEWDIAYGFPKGTVRGRLFKGFSDERAVKQPLRKTHA